VDMTVRIDTQFELVAGNITSFHDSFRAGIAAALLLEEERIEVTSVSPGSVIVDFLLMDPPSTPRTMAHEAADRLEVLLVHGLTSYFPDSLRGHMQGASVERRESRRITASGLISPGLAPLESEYEPPDGCTCVAAEQEGVRAGCGRHLGLGRPWCKTDGLCPAARSGSGVQRRWVYCSSTSGAPQSAQAEAPRTADVTGAALDDPYSLRRPSSSSSGSVRAVRRRLVAAPLAMASAVAAIGWGAISTSW